ncbi:hypothetical protein [Cochlodiniinecator piscidefendens]|uniref:hypothetical protein n=1 Tax=Cochlodiniinecator piscidefendens TaxID=2715756 RepID=UPI00140D50E5|nr:hypothetical protein [Cochlodiniinecator piscidefendens]
MLNLLLPLATESVRDPKNGMRRLLNLGLNDQTVWLFAAAVIVATTVLGFVQEFVSPPAYDGNGNIILLPSPFVLLLSTAYLSVTMSFAIAVVGRFFGGKGQFIELLLADSWLRIFAIGLMFLDMLSVLLGSGLIQILLIAGYVYLFWLLVNFVAETHETLSLGMAFLSIFVGGLAAALPFFYFLSLLGWAPPLGG